MRAIIRKAQPRHSGLQAIGAGALVILLSGGLACGGGDEGGPSETTEGGADVPLDGEENNGEVVDGEGISSPDTSDIVLNDTGAGSGELPSDDDFWVLYGLRGRIQGQNLGVTDLFLMDRDGKNPLDPKQGGPLSLTEFSLTGQKFQWCAASPNEELGCSNGCFVDEGLKWMAVQLPLPSPSQLDPESDDYEPGFSCMANMDDPPDVSLGISIQVGQFNQFMKATLIKGAILTNIVHLAFAGNYFYYSKRADCIVPSCRYDIYRVDLGTAFKGEKILTFPPVEQMNLNLWNSQYKGYFQPSRDGQFLSLLNPFFGAQQQWVWTNGNLQLIQQNCDDDQAGSCVSVGTGAEHTDRDPVTISPDAKRLVAVTKQGSRLRAWEYQVYEQVPGLWALLMSVPEGSSYKTQACNHLLHDWQYTDIDQITYSPDGNSLLYIGRSTCGSVNLKPRTNIMELSTEVLCSCKTVTDANVVNITRNPDETTASNIVWSSFDICPGGQVLAAVGTPKFDQAGKLIGDSSTAHRNDRELYLMSRDGAVLKQMTRELSWEVTSVRCLNPKVFAGPGQ